MYLVYSIKFLFKLFSFVSLITYYINYSKSNTLIIKNNNNQHKSKVIQEMLLLNINVLFLMFYNTEIHFCINLVSNFNYVFSFLFLLIFGVKYDLLTGFMRFIHLLLKDKDYKMLKFQQLRCL